MLRLCNILLSLFLLGSCSDSKTTSQSNKLTDTSDHTSISADTATSAESLPPSGTVETGNVNPKNVVAFSKTLIGIPYQYGSTNPRQGFDCSGFITYVFNHFNIAVPRSSKDFSKVGQVININEAKEGDLILFTGTDSTDREIGHMGIIVESSDSTRFIHSTSGKANGVTITSLNKYYQGRFVKTIRVFK